MAPAMAGSGARLRPATVLLVLLAGCATPVQPLIPPPLELPEKTAPVDAPKADALKLELSARISETPKPPLPEKLKTGKPDQPPPTAVDEEADIQLSFEQMPLPSFISAVYTTVLKKNINIDPKVMERKDLVTLRSGAPQKPGEVESAARLLLKSYGIAVMDIGGLVRIVPDNASLGYLPEIRRGRALPETPLPLRPVFQLVELQAVRNPDVAGWLKNMFGTKVNVLEDSTRNAVLLSGNGDDVMAAMEAIQVLDQPLMKGRQSLRITPLYWTADELANRLGEILQAEGYGTATSTKGGVMMPVTLLPVGAVNSVFAFAGSNAILEHITAWVKELDKPNEKGMGRGFITYHVQHTDAQKLAATLDKLLGGAPSAATGASQTQADASRQTAATTAPAGRVVVDPGSNSIILQGRNDDYGQVLSLLQTLDKPAKEALVEVTVAEVTLTDNAQLGVEWLFKRAGLAGYTGSVLSAGTQGGLGIGSSGFTYRFVDMTGATPLLINALASDNRATILSSPRVVARNGEMATIQVGQEVPIVTSQQVAATPGQSSTGASNVTTTTIPQTVQYKNSGVILTVKPVIHSGDQVDLDVTQEVSAPQATTTGVATSPTFSTRKLQTKLSLKNGATVVLGGLISNNRSEGNAGIPMLKDVPLIGQLFRNNTEKGDRTELIVLITPYIISDANDAQAVTSAFRKRLGGWAQTSPADPGGASEVSAP